MKSIFDKMCSKEYKDAFSSKLHGSLDTPQEVSYEINRYINSEVFTQHMNKLREGDYYFLKPPRQVMVRKSHSSRRRKVYVFDGTDGYLLKFMTFVLQDFDYLHANSLCSFRNKNRTKDFFDSVRRLDPGRELYITKADIHDWGGSIDQDIAIKETEPFFADDPDFLNFARWLMTRNEFYRNGKLMKERVSIIQGCPIGSFLGNLYLRDLDFFLESEAIVYMRYSDDIVFMTDSYQKAEWALDVIREHAHMKKLTMNEGKTQIILPGQQAELLGIQVFENGFDIGDTSIKKLCGKLTRYSNKQVRCVSYGKYTRQQAMEKMIRFYDRVFFGKKYNDHEMNWVVHAFPIVTRIDGLKKIDHCAQNCIRIAGTGKKTNSKYRVRYKDMVKAGYKNLVHAYYHGYELEDYSKL